MSIGSNSEKELPLVSIVIPAYNEEAHIESCLRSVFNLDYPEDRYETIVVDNGSTDRTRMIASTYPVRLYELPGVNVGRVRNFGSQQAYGYYLAFLDADCVVGKNWLRQGVNQLLAQSNWVLGGGIKLGDDPTWVEKNWLLECRQGATQPKELIGCNIFIRKSIFEAVGCFDESITSGEDSDLSLRLKASGYNVVIDSTLGVIHLGNAKSLLAFTTRQAWHSENYVSNLRGSVKDPVFYIVLLFLIAFVTTLVLLIGAQSEKAVITAIFTAALPTVFTLKRLKRAHIMELNPLKFALIYSLDLFYAIGRSIGIAKGAICLLRKELL